jgi:ABC-2 type transport system permease protein
MWASFRAELLVLRRSPAAWMLMAVAPGYVLLVYLVGIWSNATPGSLQTGSAALLPSQSVIQAMTAFGFHGLAPFVVLGALMAGNGWQLGTIATAVTQRPGRLAAFLGQVSVVIAACLASVLATFVVSTTVSLIVRAAAGHAADPVTAALPSAGVVARGIAFAALIGIVFGAMGIFLGTLFRSASAAIAAALVWSVILDPLIYRLGLFSGGGMLAISHAFPEASVTTLSSTFGSAGGGANTQMYLPLPPVTAVLVLAGYLVGFLVMSYLVLARRDIGAASAGRRLFRRLRPNRSLRAGWALDVHASRHASPGRRSGVLASYAAELAVFARWPTMWGLVLLPTITMLVGSYLLQYVLFRHAGGHGATSQASAASVLIGLQPGQFLATSLNTLGSASYLNGTIGFFLVGALVAGRAWGDRTLTTALLQGPGRIATVLGQVLAVASVLVGSVVLMLAMAASASQAIAATVHGPGLLASTPFPPLETIASGLGSALLVAFAWGALGMLLGVLFRNATGPAAVFLLWTVFLQVQLDQVATTITGPLRTLYNLLPDAGTNTLTGLFGSTTPYIIATVAPTFAIAILAVYVLAGFGVPVLLTRQRDIT